MPLPAPLLCLVAPSKDHLRGFSNTSLIALLVLMSVKHRSLRCILVVVAQAGLAQADLALQACQALQHWEGAVHTHRCELKCSLQSRRRGSEGPFFPFFGIYFWEIEIPVFIGAP